MKYYLEALYKSFVSPMWLAFQSQALTKAGKLFVMVVLVLSVGFGVYCAYFQLPFVAKLFQETITKEFPDFRVSVSQGVLSVSDLPQPYSRHLTIDEKDVVVVLDTVSTNTPQLTSFFTSSTQAGILITPTQIISKNLDGTEERTESLSRIPSVSFSRADIIEFLGNIAGSFRPTIVAVFTAAVFAVWGIGLFIFVLLFSLVAFALYRMLSKQDSAQRYSWKEIFTLSLFAFALPKLVVVLFSLVFSIQLPYAVVAAMAVAVVRALSIPKRGSEQIIDSKTSRVE